MVYIYIYHGLFHGKSYEIEWMIFVWVPPWIGNLNICLYHM
jgi:hypothetical protein